MSTTSISKIKSEFSLQNATCLGGFKVFLAFLEKIKLSDALSRLSGGKAHNAIFPLHRILLYLLVGWIATGDYCANELDLLIKLLAYNLFERFKRDCCEPVHQGYTIARFRLEFFQCAATLIRHSRNVILKLAKDFANRHVWKRIEARIALLE